MTDRWMPLILSDPSPCLRYLVLTNLLDIDRSNKEVIELDALRREDPIALEAAELQKDDGSWTSPDTPAILFRLGTLGFDSDYDPVSRGAEYLFSRQRSDGSWPIPATTVYDGKERVGFDMIPLQTALPLCGLCACGYAEDPRVARAFDWLLEQRLPDGVWPSGIASGVHGYVAGYRRMPHSRWGCRSNTTGSLIALSLHPKLRTGAEARHALDALLARETREHSSLGFQTARTLGFEPTKGFFTRFALFDPGLMAELASRIGATDGDNRVSDLVAFIAGGRGPFGLWEYANRPQASRWVSYMLLNALTGIDRNSGQELAWMSHEPRTPFQAYQRPRRRW